MSPEKTVTCPVCYKPTEPDPTDGGPTFHLVGRLGYPCRASYRVMYESDLIRALRLLHASGMITFSSLLDYESGLEVAS